MAAEYFTFGHYGVEQDIDEGQPVLALQDLIRVQTTWVDPAELLNDSKAVALIEEVEGLAAKYETEGDLLKARQALYLLNTIYDGVQTRDGEDASSTKGRRDEYEQRLRVLGRKVQIMWHCGPNAERYDVPWYYMKSRINN